MTALNAKPNMRQGQIGVVVIGRNEGKRLERCLQSLVTQTAGPMVYVDSGSTDGSVEFAQNLGVIVENLDTSIPFTMARGRNTGFNRLIRECPQLNYVQFVDGDCEVNESWIDHAITFLDQHRDVVTLCGILKERFPEASIYNHLANMEWQATAGEARSCGGNAIYRVDAFKQSGGFNETLIAGEEPELCVRLRQAGGRIWRLDKPMAIHDANITRFTQWWRRATRGGHGYAEGAALHGSSPQRHYVRELARAIIYGMAVPWLFLTGLFLGVSVPGLSLLVPVSLLVFVLIYIKPFLGAWRSRRRQANSISESLLYAAFNLLAKFPEAQGVLKYYINRALNRQTGIIEYKIPPS